MMGIAQQVGRSRERHDGHGRVPPLWRGVAAVSGRSRPDPGRAGGAEAAGWTVLSGGCQQRGGQDPYTPLVDALARHCQGLTESGQRAALAGCAWLVRLLPELAAAPIEPLAGWHVTPDQERRLMV